MAERVTADERQQLDAIADQMRAISDRVAQRALTDPKHDVLGTLMGRAAQNIRFTRAERAAMLWLQGATQDDYQAHDTLTAQWNAIIAAAKARRVARETVLANQRERAAVRAAMCQDCFTVHAGECV